MPTIYKFVVHSGMRDYMPNYSSGPHFAHTRRELVEILKNELDMLNYPANRIRDFSIRNIWRFIQNVGSGSSVHLICQDHNGEALQVCGLTDEEADAMEAELDY